MTGLRLSLVLLGAMVVSVCVASPQNNHDFGFHAGAQFRTENKGEDGKTRGEYGFRTPDGCMHVIMYQADTRGGYRVLGSTKRDCQIKTTRPPTIPLSSTTRRPITTRQPFTTRQPTVTTRQPITTRQPTFTTRRPTTTTRRPITTTRRPITTTTSRPITNTTRRPITTTTRRPTTTIRQSITRKPTDPFKVPPVKEVDNAIPEESHGRQLLLPNQASIPIQADFSPTTTTTPKPGEEPLYTFGYTTPTHGHSESGLPNGGKKGEYYWDGPDGYRRIVTYVANERGFFPKMRTVRIPTTTPKPPPTPEVPEGGGVEGEGEGQGKDLDGNLPKPAGGCPYYFYYNTRINYHWEHCYENHTKVGEYGELSSDGYQHKNAYYADITGYHPRISKTKMTDIQLATVAEYQAGIFIIPKPDEERRATEKRILQWLEDNRNKIDDPLRR